MKQMMGGKGCGERLAERLGEVEKTQGPSEGGRTKTGLPAGFETNAQ